MNSVAIIGGGITGLTAGFRLRERGLPVTLFEASPRVGGVIASTRRDGYLAECGPNTLLETSPRVSGLVHDVGLDGRRMYSEAGASNRYLVRGGRMVALPVSPLGFLTTPLFSVKAKLRLLLEPFIPRGGGEREESLAEFVLRRIGREFLDYAVNPFVAGVYAGDPARLSVEQAFPKLYALEQKYGSLIGGQVLGARERKRRAEVSKQNAPKLSFDEGLQVLTDELGSRLGSGLRLNAAVTAVQQTTDGWLVTSLRAGQEIRETYGAVLYAAPAYKLAQIQVQSSGPKLAPLATIYYPPVSSVVLGFRREDVAHPLDGFGVLIPEVERLSILGTIFSSSLFPNRAPAGHVLLTSYVGGVRAPDLALKSTGELVDLVVRDLGRLLGVSGRPAFVHHMVFPKAIPQYELGYGRFKALMAEMESRGPGFFLAGHYRDGISLSDSIVSGDSAAERIGCYLAQAGSGARGAVKVSTEAVA